MQTVADIMTRKVICLKENDTLHRGRMILKEYNIRHLPVINEEGKLVGLLMQRDILNNAFNVIEKYGFSKLKSKEEQILIKDIMTSNCATTQSDVSLIEAGQFFVDKKNSCLPVVDDGEMVGILTSVDFVKLSLRLLEQRQV